MTAIECDRLIVGYRAEPVVREVSLSVQPGEIVAVLGANGAGKTTLFKTMAGLMQPRSGSVELDGQPLGRQPPEARARRGLLLVPEGRRLFPTLSTLDNLRTGGFTGRDGYSVDEVLALFPRLADRQESLAGKLSGGEQQMLAIGRALCGGPDVLLIDEPSLGLAPRITDSVFEAFGRLARSGLAVLIAEQNVQAAMRVADRCIVLDRGNVTLSASVHTAEGREVIEQAYTATVDIDSSTRA
jgi:branched-chain amino acid transport system ATP-binding protein